MHTVIASSVWRWKRFWGYIGVYTLVNMVALAVVLLRFTGRISVRNLAFAKKMVQAGNVIITTNHPSALETFILPVLFWPDHLFSPRLFPWSIAGSSAFPRGTRWLYGPFRCVLVPDHGSGGDKSKRLAQVVRSIASVQEVLRRRGVVIVYPEGSRTCKATHQMQQGTRCIGVVSTFIPVLANRSGSSVVPVYVDFGDVVEPLSFATCLKRIVCTHKMTITFGLPYSISPQKDRSACDTYIRSRILSAGRE